jgi:hypothetical protein
MSAANEARDALRRSARGVGARAAERNNTKRHRRRRARRRTKRTTTDLN